MPSATNLTARDLDGVLGVVAEAAAAQEDTPFGRPLIEQLIELVPADWAGYYEYQGVRPGVRDRPCHIFQVENTGVWGNDALQRWTDRVAEHLPHWPLHDNRLRGSQTAVKFSDFCDERAKRRNSWYAEVMRAGSQEHECKLLLPARDGTIGGFFFSRELGRRDFDERDRAILTVLRMQLAAIRDRWERRRSPPGLTARETEIAHLLREGLTNQEIADRLVISTGTVRTHLENMFDKLGVHTRTAAVARAFGQAQLHKAG